MRKRPVGPGLRTGSLQGAPTPARKRGLRLWSADGSARAVSLQATELVGLDAAVGEEGADGPPQGVDSLLGRVLGIGRHVEDLAVPLGAAVGLEAVDEEATPGVDPEVGLAGRSA